VKVFIVPRDDDSHNHAAFMKSVAEETCHNPDCGHAMWEHHTDVVLDLASPIAGIVDYEAMVRCTVAGCGCNLTMVKRSITCDDGHAPWCPNHPANQADDL